MHNPWLSLSQMQCEYLPCLLPVVSSRPFFWGKVAFDVAGLDVGLIQTRRTLFTNRVEGRN